MKSKEFEKRLAASAKDFAAGVQPALEQLMRSKIFPIDSLYSVELASLLDQSGVDAFTFDKNLNCRALASRMNYHRMASTKPAFTFRYALWDKNQKSWDCRREYFKKLAISRNPASFRLFPYYHVESYCKEKFSALIGWSFIAKTSDILKFAETHIDNSKCVWTFEPRSGERRIVLSVSIEAFAREYPIREIKIPCPSEAIVQGNIA